MNIFKRKPTEYFLIGYANKNVGRNLPTLRRLLQNCLFYREQHQTIENSVTLTIKNAMIIWESMGIQIKRLDSCERKLNREYAEWKELIKNKKYKSEGQNQKRETFIKKLDVEFDVNCEPKIEAQKNESELLRTEFDEIELSDAQIMNTSEECNDSDGINNNIRLTFHIQ